MKPLAWHSSSAAITSAQPGRFVSGAVRRRMNVGWRTLLMLFGVEMGMHGKGGPRISFVGI
jgi:hypothetical protein